MLKKIRGVVASLLVVLFAPTSGLAQGLETLGNRAAALAAFVAVADDASAVAWNPAGLVSGPLFNITVGFGRTKGTTDDLLVPDAQSGRLNGTLVAIGTTPVGLAFYRISSASAQPAGPAVLGTPDREKRQAIVRTLVTNHLGIAVQQSVGDYLTLGATLKLVRGSVGRATVASDSWDEAFERAQAFEWPGSTRGDLDIGAMLAAGRVRAGVVIRNMSAPSFDGAGEDADDGAVRLERHARVGAAWGDSWPGISRLIMSVDADLTRVPHPVGARRDVAAGVERWLRGQQVGLRAGVRASTVGDARPIVSAGGSFAVRAGMYLDGYLTRGPRMERGWGVAARVTY